jgi:hypothetical protein
MLCACHHSAPQKSKQARAARNPSASAVAPPSAAIATASSAATSSARLDAGKLAYDGRAMGQAGKPEHAEGDAGASGAATIRLLEPGRAPRAKLRYRFAVGRVDQFALTTRTGISVSVAGQTLPAPSLPGVEIDAALRVLGIAPDGAAKREFDVRGVKVLNGPGTNATVRTELEQTLDGFDKLRGHDEMTRQGVVRDAALDVKSITNPRLRQLMQSLRSAFGEMGAPFPSQAIGVGARWEVDSHVEQQGMHLTQVARYELTRLNGSSGSTRVTLTQTAPSGPLQAPGLPSGVHAELLSIHSKGGGQLDFDLGRMVPDGHLDTQTDVEVRTQQNGHSQDTAMDMSLHVEFHPAQAAGAAGHSAVITKP